MRDIALLLRLAAAELQHEVKSVLVLRRILTNDLGWQDSAIDAALTTIRRATNELYRQAELFERAA